MANEYSQPRLGQENKILDDLQYEQWEEKLLEIERDAATLETMGERVLADYYGEAGDVSE